MSEAHVHTRPTRGARWTRRVLWPTLSRWLALLGLVIAGGFVVGRVLTDTRHWSQYLYWIPVLWVLISCWGLWGLSALLGWRGLRPKGNFVRALLVLMCLGMTLFALVFVWRVQRPVLRLVSSGPEPDLRVVHWNIAADSFDVGTAAGVILDQDPDIALIANARWDGQRSALLEALGELIPDSDETGPRLAGSLLIASKYPVTHWGVVWLDPSANPEANTRSTGDRGWVVLLGIDVPDRDAPLVVWVVDLPSEPTQWRQETMDRAIRAGTRADVRVRTVEDAPVVDLSVPDLIVGDFNTPRGSDSLARFDGLSGGGYVDAFERAGWGRGRSWVPVTGNPLARGAVALGDWHIDLALVGEGLRATGYGLFGPAPSDHRAQRIELVFEP